MTCDSVMILLMILMQVLFLVVFSTCGTDPLKILNGWHLLGGRRWDHGVERLGLADPGEGLMLFASTIFRLREFSLWCMIFIIHINQWSRAINMYDTEWWKSSKPWGFFHGFGPLCRLPALMKLERHKKIRELLMLHRLNLVPHRLLQRRVLAYKMLRSQCVTFWWKQKLKSKRMSDLVGRRSKKGSALNKMVVLNLYTWKCRASRLTRCLLFSAFLASL